VRQLRLAGTRGLLRSAPTSIRLGAVAQSVCRRRRGDVDVCARVAHEQPQDVTPLSHRRATVELSVWPAAYRVPAQWRDAQGTHGDAVLGLPA
jgi:hypothetical protein